MTGSDPDTLQFYADEAVRYANQLKTRSYRHLDSFLDLLILAVLFLSLDVVAVMTALICWLAVLTLLQRMVHWKLQPKHRSGSACPSKFCNLIRWIFKANSTPFGRMPVCCM